MALTTIDPEATIGRPWKDDRPNLPPAPEVAVTPCDLPWPRPYFLEGGLRRVAPYYYTYNTFCKQRWRGREILDIFAKEFRDRTPEYYQQAIEDGRIVLNGKPCADVHTQVQNGDVISHTLHRHEPPVTAQPIRAIFEDDAMIVIDKPAGVPVHPAGRYRYNSIVEIMRAERDHAFNPLPCNRLDRLTSGVMFIGKTGHKAEAISAKLRERTVRKEYVARVKGRFPDGEEWDGDAMRGGVVKCEEPILQISPVLGLNRARASGKSAKTLFRRIAYYRSNEAAESSVPQGSVGEKGPLQTTIDAVGTATALPTTPIPGTEDEGYSIVHCLPLTGRTHQIRVHLQFLGYPISNDPIYSNRKVFGADLGRNDNSAEKDAEIMEKLGKMGKTELAEAYSYTKEDKKRQSAEKESQLPSSPSAATAGSSVPTLLNLVDQTQQMTLTDVLRAEEYQKRQQGQNQQEVQSNTPMFPPATSIPQSSSPTATTGQSPSASMSYFNTHKPLPQSLHAGPLPQSVLSQNNNNTTTTSTTNGQQPLSGNDALDEAYLQAHNAAVEDYNKRKGEKLTGQHCPLCFTPLYSDPGPHELGIYLHALAYADLGGEWKYRSRMPDWARPPGTSSLSPSSSPSNQETPAEIPEWIYKGAGSEGLNIGDEKESEAVKNEEAMRINREMVDGVLNGRP